MGAGIHTKRGRRGALGGVELGAPERRGDRRLRTRAGPGGAPDRLPRERRRLLQEHQRWRHVGARGRRRAHLPDLRRRHERGRQHPGLALRERQLRRRPAEDRRRRTHVPGRGALAVRSHLLARGARQRRLRRVLPLGSLQIDGCRRHVRHRERRSARGSGHRRGRDRFRRAREPVRGRVLGERALCADGLCVDRRRRDVGADRLPRVATDYTPHVLTDDAGGCVLAGSPGTGVWRSCTGSASWTNGTSEAGAAGSIRARNRPRLASTAAVDAREASGAGGTGPEGRRGP